MIAMKRLILRPAIFLAVLLSGFSVNIKAQDLDCCYTADKK